MTKDNVAQWLGNRGYDVEPTDIIKSKQVGNYIFVQQKEEPKEVALFDLYDSYGETIDYFSTKTFQWNLNYLRRLITGECQE